MSGPLPGLSVIVPCYNEREAIADVLRELDRTLSALDRPFEILLVDDGSTDDSADRIPTLAMVLRHPCNLGYGASIKTGARSAKYPTLVITDADGTYPNECIGELLQAFDGHAMVVGARTGPSVHIPAIRRPAKWLLTRLAIYLTGIRIPDLNSGFRVIDRDFFMQYIRYYPDGFSITTTMTLAALTNGHPVRYVPIDYHARVGRSKIRPIRDTIEFVKLILRTVLYFDPLKIFVPLSFSLLLASLAVGIISNMAGEFMDVTTTALFVTALQFLAIGALADLISKRLP